MKKKITISSLIGTLLFTSPLSLTNSQKTYASSSLPMNSNIENLNETDFEQSFSLVYNEGDKTDFNIEYTDDKILLTTLTDNTTHTFEYIKGDDFATMDGEIIYLVFETFDDPSLMNDIASSTQLTRATDDYTPVYMTTASISFNKLVNDTSEIVTVIGGVIGIAGIIGSNISKNTIVQKVSDWASAVGFSTLVVSKTFSGKITYDQYKTRGQVSTGYGTKQQALRNDNVRAIASILSYKVDIQLRAKGDWYFGSKPY